MRRAPMEQSQRGWLVSNDKPNADACGVIPETEAMRKIVDAVAKLNGVARERVFRYVARFLSQGGKETLP